MWFEAAGGRAGWGHRVPMPDERGEDLVDELLAASTLEAMMAVIRGAAGG